MTALTIIYNSSETETCSKSQARAITLYNHSIYSIYNTITVFAIQSQYLQYVQYNHSIYNTITVFTIFTIQPQYLQYLQYIHSIYNAITVFTDCTVQRSVFAVIRSSHLVPRLAHPVRHSPQSHSSYPPHRMGPEDQVSRLITTRYPEGTKAG